MNEEVLKKANKIKKEIEKIERDEEKIIRFYKYSLFLKTTEVHNAENIILNDKTKRKVLKIIDDDIQARKESLYYDFKNL